eukprot:7205523-Prymnesium_polylepis.1
MAPHCTPPARASFASAAVRRPPRRCPQPRRPPSRPPRHPRQPMPTKHRAASAAPSRRTRSKTWRVRR